MDKLELDISNTKNIKNIKIIFFGTPDFAVASLEAIYNAGFNIVAVVTVPDKPSGRGLNMQSSQIKDFAVSKNIDVLQPQKLKDSHFISQLQTFNADLFIVVAFRMLPEVVWNMPPMGTINVHASLLPQYRGAAPINWAIINGEAQTGVTTFKLKHEIDTGNILLQKVVQIRDDENVGELYKTLMKEGALLLIQTIHGLIDNNIQELVQDTSGSVIKHAPKIFKEMTLIDWNKSAIENFNFIRGLSPYPAAFTYIDNKKIKIYSSKVSNVKSNAQTGSYDTDSKTFLRIACNDVWLEILEVQQEGKKQMDINSFLRGFRFNT